MAIISNDKIGKYAKETTDDLFLEKVNLLKIGQDGLPENQRLNVDLLVKDPAIILGQYEKLIWAIILVFGIAFASMVLVFV